MSGGSRGRVDRLGSAAALVGVGLLLAACGKVGPPQRVRPLPPAPPSTEAVPTQDPAPADPWALFPQAPRVGEEAIDPDAAPPPEAEPGWADPVAPTEAVDE